MKNIVILLTGSSLILFGCSKSNNSAPGANNANSTAASSASSGAAGGGPAELKLKWLTGKQYDMQLDMNQSSDIDYPGHPIHQELKLTQGLSYSPLKDLENGGHQVELKFNRQNIDLTQNGKEIVSYDSTQKTPLQPGSPAAPVAAAMGAMLDAPLDYTFAPDGSVQKIDGIDSLAGKITAAVPDQQQRASMQQLYDADTLKQYGDFSHALPDHPVNIGDSWSSTEDINSPAGVMTVDGTYTFKNREQHDDHNCVHILVNGDVKTKSATASSLGAVVKIQKGTINGDAWFDPDLGMFVDSKTDQDMTLDITTRQTSFTEHMKQNIEMSLVSVNP
ncbi:MAG TPA: DUF6263 family protein [Verrucomicrobiae bacterium]|nr:DUF6263 family protein [Verrucomicrobiae bacterium]